MQKMALSNLSSLHWSAINEMAKGTRNLVGLWVPGFVSLVNIIRCGGAIMTGYSPHSFVIYERSCSCDIWAWNNISLNLIYIVDLYAMFFTFLIFVQQSWNNSAKISIHRYCAMIHYYKTYIMKASNHSFFVIHCFLTKAKAIVYFWVSQLTVTLLPPTEPHLYILKW